MAVFSERIALLIEASTGGATAPLGALERQARQTDDAFDRMGRRVGTTGATLRQGLTQLGSMALGAGLVAGVQKLATEYADAAKSADDLAGATGSSIETVSAMQAALTDAGVSADKAAALLTKFTTVASGSKGAAALKELNVELVKGANGSVDYAASMVKAVDAIMEIGDAAERNRQLVALFGKSAAKDFQDLINSGVSLSEAINQIDAGRILTDEDAQRAQNFDAMMDSLAASAKTLAITFGAALVPAATTLGNVLTPLVGTLGDIPPNVYLVVGSVVALNVAMESAFVTGGLALAAGAVRSFIATLVALRVGMITTSTVVIGAWEAMTAAMLANPFVLIAAGIAAVAASTVSFNSAMRKAGDEMARFTDKGKELKRISDELEGDPILGVVADRMQAEEAANSVQAFIDSLEGVRTVAADADTAISQLGAAVDGLNSSFIDAEEAGDRAKAALGGWNTALKEGKGLDEERQAALREAVKTQADYIDKLVESGASAKTVKAANDKWVESLYAAGAAAGVSREDIDKYLKKLGFIPAEVTTEVLADTLSAEDDIKSLKKKIDGLPDSVKIPVYIKAIIQNPGAFAKVERMMNENRSAVPAPGAPVVSPMGSLLVPVAAAGSSTKAVTVTQNFTITVPGAGSPAVTAREIDRYIRRAGNQRLASVTG